MAWTADYFHGGRTDDERTLMWQFAKTAQSLVCSLEDCPRAILMLIGSFGLGDTNGDRHVGLEDLNAVRNNFGSQADSALFVEGPIGLELNYLAAKPMTLPPGRAIRHIAVDAVHEGMLTWQRWGGAVWNDPFANLAKKSIRRVVFY